MGEEKSLETYYLLTKLSDSSGKCVVLCREDLNLLLKVGQPLLLALTTLKRSNSIRWLVYIPSVSGDIEYIPVSLEEILTLFFIGHLLVVRSSLHIHIVHVGLILIH